MFGTLKSEENSPCSNESDRLLDSLVVECWLRVREVTGSIPSQGPRHTKDVIKNGTSSSLVWHSTLKREILALSEELKMGQNM